MGTDTARNLHALTPPADYSHVTPYGRLFIPLTCNSSPSPFIQRLKQSCSHFSATLAASPFPVQPLAEPVEAQVRSL